MNFFVVLILALLLAGCNEKRHKKVVEPAGTMFVISDHYLQDAYFNLLTSLNENEKIKIMAEVDFKANARELQREINAMRIVFFGNPNLGTPLMQQNQLAALDLPQRILIFEHEGTVYTMYNSRKYLESRYKLGGIAVLQDMHGAMEKLAIRATGKKPMQAPLQGVPHNQGIITLKSKGDFEGTYNRLKEALQENSNWQIIMELDHSENAAGIDLQLRPTRLLVLSNPYLQTNILENNPTAALDFPSKILIWEDEQGIINITYNDPGYVQERHQITGNDEELAEIAAAFKRITNFASIGIHTLKATEEEVEVEMPGEGVPR